MRWQRYALVAAAVAVAGSALAVALRPGGDAPAEPPLRLSATGEQWRTHEVARELAIALHNDGDVPVQVARVEPVLPSFAGEAAVDTDTLLPPGGLRVDVPVPYGTGGCTPATAASAHVVVHARAEGAVRWQRVTVALPHPNPLLDKLLAADCATQRVRQSVTLAFGPWQDLGPRGLRGTLLVGRSPTATGPVQVRELDGNVMYRFAFPGAPSPTGRASPGPAGIGEASPTGRGEASLAEVTAAAPHAEIPLTVDPQRCDLHAFAEVKKPYEFPAQISLAGADPLPATVPVTDADRTALDTMLRRLCRVPAAAGT